MDNATFQQTFYMALAHHRNQEHHTAASLCGSLMKVRPNQAEVLHLAGKVELARGRLANAEAFVRRAVDLKPDSALFLQTLATICARNGNAETAERLEGMAMLLDSAHTGATPRLRAGPHTARREGSWTGEALIFGANFFAHDNSIFLIDPDRREVAAISAERLTRYKHDYAPPDIALTRLIDYLGIDPEQIREVRFAGSFTGATTQARNLKRSHSALLLRRALNAPYIGDYNRLYRDLMGRPTVEQMKLLAPTPEGRAFLAHWNHPFDPVTSMADSFADQVHRLFPNAVLSHRHYDHQFCHAVASYFSAPFEAGLAITMDGMGDDNVFSRAYVAGRDGFRLIASSQAPKQFLELGDADRNRIAMASIGGIYSWFTECLGFSGGDEGKVEALAAFGKPVASLLAGLQEAVRLDPGNHAITVDTDAVEALVNVRAMDRLLAETAAADLAATIQTFLELSVAGYVEHLVRLTGETRLMLSGGVFANVILNLKIMEEISDRIAVCPAMGDDGTAQGAAILALLEQGRSMDELMWLKEREMPYFGTSYGRAEIEEALAGFRDRVEVTDLGPDWPEKVAELLVEHKVGGIFHGRMEWGPRALGNRSIVADPRDPGIRDRINLSIKKRTSFQPFCPSILLEEKDRLFEAAYVNKHMTCAFRLRPEFREQLPGAIHIDGTARVQFVSEEDNPNYWRLLKAVKARTGFGVVINTSFNKHGRTIVETPQDALTDFIDTDMPFLCLEGLLVTRKP